MKIYILVENGNFVREVSLADEYPNTSFPAIITQDQLPENVYECYIEPRPYSAVANYVQNSPQLIDSKWTITWAQVPVSQYELDLLKQRAWDNVREKRDALMTMFDWRYLRYNRETRLGVTPTDDILKLDEYMKALADITLQQDPFNIEWPVEP